jgi:hypothetical protein
MIDLIKSLRKLQKKLLEESKRIRTIQGYEDDGGFLCIKFDVEPECSFRLKTGPAKQPFLI